MTILEQLKWRDIEIAPPSDTCLICIKSEIIVSTSNVELFVQVYVHLSIGLNVLHI